jgi:uncharacterized membrane protein (Fun14 family)
MSETPEKSSLVQKSTSESNSPIWEKAAHPFPMWRKCVFGIALILGLGGLGLQVAAIPDTPDGHLWVSANISESSDGAKNAEATASTPPALSAQSATQSPGTQASQTALSSSTGQTSSGGLREKLDTPLGQFLDDWSAPMMQLGFSFVAGFSMGYALAFFLKATALVAGVLLLMLFGLQYAGLADVNWLGIQGYYDTFIAWVQPHAGSFQEFITSNLPVSGMAALGIFTGFKKK